MRFVPLSTAPSFLLDRNVRASAIMLSAIAIASWMAVLIRFLGDTYSPFQLVLVRSAFMLIVLLPLLLRSGYQILRTNRPGLMLIRGVLGFAGQVFGVLAILNLPLAEAQAIGFTKGFIVAMLGMALLKEDVTLVRWTAILLGFLGVLLVVNPGHGMNWSALYALGSAGCFAVNTIIMKILVATHTRQALMTYSAVLQFAFACIPALLVWQQPLGIDWVWFAGMGLIALIVQPLNLTAYRMGDVSALAPVDFCRLLTSAAIGYWIFSEVPDLIFWLGAALIVCANLLPIYVARQKPVSAAEPTNQGTVI
ncbi:MAG: DMT family transporter [Pseudomonadota bacterium]